MLLLLFVVKGTWCGSDDSNELLLFEGSALRRAFRTGADPGCEIGTNANAKGASAHTRRSGADFLVVESMLLVGIPLASYVVVYGEALAGSADVFDSIHSIRFDSIRFDSIQILFRCAAARPNQLSPHPSVLLLLTIVHSDR